MSTAERVALTNLRRQQPRHHLTQRRIGGVRRQQLDRLAAADRVFELIVVTLEAPERTIARQHFVEQHAERPVVHLLVDRAGLQPLGRHVLPRAPLLRRFEAALGHRLRDAEVEHADVAVGPDAHVARLQIGVDDALGRAARHLEAMRLFEERGELDRDVERALPRQRSARERVEQVFARHVFHHHVEAAARLGDLLDERHQPVMTREFLLQLRAAALRVGNRAVARIGADRDQLQRAQLALAVLARGVDRGASARADHRLQHVVAQDPVQICCSLMHGVTGRAPGRRGARTCGRGGGGSTILDSRKRAA